MAEAEVTIPGFKGKDLTGKRFGKWTVVRFSRRAKSNYFWICRCDCGTEKEVGSPGNPSMSCGCQPPLAERFWSKVLKTSEESCWLFSGSKTTNGYGNIRNEDHKLEQASRVAYRLTYGVIPDGMHVLHRCDCPPCCNPSHLFLGNHADNMADKVRKGRQPHKLTPEQVRSIFLRFKAGEMQANLAREHGVLQSAIYGITKRRTWRMATASLV